MYRRNLRNIALGLARQLLLRDAASTRTFTHTIPAEDAPKSDSLAPMDIEQLLSKPTWSITSLLPPSQPSADIPAVSSTELHHLLRLSALPPPSSPAAEAKMLNTLSAQLHFVKTVQNVDTTGVVPLMSLRDETAAGEKEAEIGMEALGEALSTEEVTGKWHKRIRRKRVGAVEGGGREQWDVLEGAERKVGRYFVVEGGKD